MRLELSKMRAERAGNVKQRLAIQREQSESGQASLRLVRCDGVAFF